MTSVSSPTVSFSTDRGRKWHGFSIAILTLAAALLVPCRVALAERWVGVGPDGGSIRSVVVDPTDANVAYIGTSGGVHKTTDGGVTWRIASNGLAALNPFLDYSVLAISPSNPNVLYANAGLANLTYRSNDGGLTWTPAGGGLPSGFYLGDLVVHPTNPNIAYATSQYWGVFKTTDGGASWNLVGSGLPDSVGGGLVINPSAPSTLYVATGEGVYKTTNGGSSWVASSSGLPGGEGIASLAINPTNPAILYAAVYTGSPYFYSYGVFKTANSGSSWSLVSSGLPTGYDLSPRRLVINPASPNTIYAVVQNAGVFKTTNGGSSWTAASIGLPQDSFGQFVYMPALAIAPTSPGTLYAGLNADGASQGLYKTTNGGGIWSASSSGLAVDSFSLVVATSTDPATVYAARCRGYGATALVKSSDGGATWDELGIPGEYQCIGSIAASRATPSVLFVTDANNVALKSVDGGQSWTPLASLPPTSQISTWAIDPFADPQTIYAGAIEGVLRSVDGGDSWTLRKEGLPETLAGIAALAVDPSTPGVLYVGGGGIPGVYKSTNGGDTWSATGPQLTGYVRSIVVDPSDPDVVFASRNGGGVYRSDDGGATWSQKNAGIPTPVVYQITIDPTNPSVLYATLSSYGIYQSRDRGETWTPLHQGLVAKGISSIAIDPNFPGRLYGATQGQSIVRLTEVCGDGVLDVAEACDVGHNGRPGSCCSIACSFKSAGETCRAAAGSCDAVEACDGSSDVCPADLALPDQDADGVCDVQDDCTNIDGRAFFIAKPKSKIVLSKVHTDPNPLDDQLVVAGSFELPADARFSDLALNESGARLVVKDANGTTLADALLPPGDFAGKGTRGWKRNASGTTWQYLDRTGSAIAGIVGLKAVDRGMGVLGERVAVTASGKKASYPVLATSAPLSVAVVFGDAANAASGMCGESAFSGGDCAFNKRGNMLKCSR